MHRLLAVVLLAFSAASHAAIQTQEIPYTSADGTKLIGYYAYDDAVKGPRPGVVVVHEWWGLNDYSKRRARDLAGLGYSALAIDMYGDGKNTEHPKDAMAFMQAALKDGKAASARFQAGLDLLKKQPHTDPDKIAAIGYCFGGKVVLDMARQGVPLDGVVSFHGALATETRGAPGCCAGRCGEFPRRAGHQYPGDTGQRQGQDPGRTWRAGQHGHPGQRHRVQERNGQGRFRLQIRQP